MLLNGHPSHPVPAYFSRRVSTSSTGIYTWFLKRILVNLLPYLPTYYCTILLIVYSKETTPLVLLQYVFIICSYRYSLGFRIVIACPIICTACVAFAADDAKANDSISTKNV